ncbi:FDXR family protein [Megaselia abdita]
MNMLPRVFLRSYSSIPLIKKKIAIVGGGPAGFYAAQYIAKNLSNCEIDILEKLPVPFGLVRFGVAPDHPEVKNVINTFTKTAENPSVRFLGNIALGQDVSLKELREQYHAVLLTYGADQDHRLNIPNEDQENVISARKFVAWYNGLPGAENLQPKLTGDTVTIIGQGNVAIDVARILLSPVDLLKNTDITEYSLEALSTSNIKRVQLVGRRGPLQAAFTIKELREMLKLPNVTTVWRREDFEGVEDLVASLQRPRKRLTELMLTSLKAQNFTDTQERQFLPIFLRSPETISYNSLDVVVNKMAGDKAVKTKDMENLPADLILRSIGYRSTCADSEIPFNEKAGKVFNHNGRVLVNGDSEVIDRGLYTAGWLGTGPTGVILTTMNTAFGVGKHIVDDFNGNLIKCDQNKPGLDIKKLRAVTWDKWERIDKAEIEAGAGKGKPREKIVSINTMLEVAGV